MIDDGEVFRVSLVDVTHDFAWFFWWGLAIPRRLAVEFVSGGYFVVESRYVLVFGPKNPRASRMLNLR